jgi:hypothetical protein
VTVADTRPGPAMAVTLDDGQREVLAAALADAIAHREPARPCAGCEAYPAYPEGLCDDHAADQDLCDAYEALGRELGIEVNRPGDLAEPEPEEYDPGPEADDEGGMSEYRYAVLPAEEER